MNVIKKIVILLLLLPLNFCLCQVKNGTVQYGLIVNNISEFAALPKEMAENLYKNNRASEKVEYTLNFNSNEAYFFANSILLEEKNSLNFLVTIGNGKLKYYQNSTTKDRRELIDYSRTGPAIVNKNILFDWTLTTEIKEIDGRKCFKAISPKINPDTGEKNIDPKWNVVAWYCPEIPSIFGPLGYGNLPGLILELNFYANTFYAKKINLNLEKELVIDKLTSMPAISEDELNKRFLSSMSKDRLEMLKEAEDKIKGDKK